MNEPTRADAQRQEMIAIAAYYLAEQRGFAPGGAERDWLEAERVIDQMLAHRYDDPTIGHDRHSAIRNALRLYR